MRKTPVKRVNRARRAKNHARAYGGKARIEFVKSLPCLVGNMACEGPSHNAHTKTGGTGRKADAKAIAPLCFYHHDALHRYGQVAFECSYEISLSRAAAETERLWQEHLAEGNE